MYEIIEGKKAAAELIEKVKEDVSKLDKKPGLAVVIIGNDPASKIYVNMKEQKCKETGIDSYKYEFDENVSEKEVLELIDKLNNDEKINGILVQIPIPLHLSNDKIMEAIAPEKDVDGFTAVNIGKNIIGEQGLQPCTPRGVMKLFEYHNIELKGKEAVVIGNSVIAGNPIAQMLLKKWATVTVCHIETKDLKKHVKEADIIVSVVGKKNLITADMVKQGAVIIDVGMVRDGKNLCGDVDFENVKDKCSYITPVPGGVGPMTVASLMENTLYAYTMQNKLEVEK